MTALSEALGPARLMAKGANAALKAHGLGAADIARSLADHILALVVDLLPSGHCEGHE